MSDVALGPVVVTLAASAGAVAATMLVAFLLGVVTGRHSVVDTIWGLGFVVVALVALVASAGQGSGTRRLVVVTLVALWGVRLAVHVGRRALRSGEDRRYVALLARAPGSRDRYALRVVYLPQGLVMWWVSLPVQLALVERGPIGLLGLAGAAVALGGIAFEAIGDAQLGRFLAERTDRSAVMDRGLWRYTRHPNYFGDACFWWGIYVVAAARAPGALTVLSPVVMTALLTRGSGKALLERDIADRRPGYADYVRRTSGFVPLPPRRT